jgi:hypothetical protein
VALSLRKKPPCTTPARATELWNRLFHSGNLPEGPNVRGHTPTFRVHGSEIKVSTPPRPEQTRKNRETGRTRTQIHKIVGAGEKRARRETKKNIDTVCRRRSQERRKDPRVLRASASSAALQAVILDTVRICLDMGAETIDPFFVPTLFA